MRLIDDEMLKSRIGELCINNCDLFSALMYDRIIGVIEATPTIETVVLCKKCSDDYLNSDRQQYEKGFKDGMQEALKKIVATLNPKSPEICVLYAMQWIDEGCCMDCFECIKNHSG